MLPCPSIVGRNTQRSFAGQRVGMTKCEFDPPMMFLYTLEMDKGRQAKRASFFSMLSNGWALLFGLVLLNNKSRENSVPLRSEPLTTPGPNHLLTPQNLCDVPMITSLESPE